MKKIFLNFLFFFSIFLFLPILSIQGEELCPSMPLDGGSANLPVTLDWCDILNADSYEVKIKKTSGECATTTPPVNCEILNTSTDSTMCTKSLLDNDSVYEWQVKPCNEGSCGSFGATWNFTTSGEQNITAPSLTSPSNGGVVSIPVALDWNNVAGAKSYYIEIYDKSSDILIVNFTSDTADRPEIGINTLNRNTEYEWAVASCLGEGGTACGPSCCFTEYGEICRSLSSRKTFETNNIATFNNPTLLSPSASATTTPIKPFDIFKWSSNKAEGFIFTVNKDSNEIIRINTQNTTTTLSDYLWEDETTSTNTISFNANYVWEVTPCWWDSENNTVEGCSPISSSQPFITAGGTTMANYPGPTSSETLEVWFNWEKAPNTSSYLFKLQEGINITSTSTTQNNRLFLSYPDIQPLTDYSWGVKACIEDNGTFCEKNWHEKNFSTESFNPPYSQQLTSGQVFTYEYSLSWGTNTLAKSYEYTIQYNEKALEETNTDCLPGTPIATNIISNSNYILMPDLPGTKQKCLGEYTLWVTACLTENCENKNSENSTTTAWTFDYMQSKAAEGVGGIIPCGRNYDFTNTDWNERESCQLKHVPILLYSIIDFILWKASLIALLGLIVFSGVIAYASAGLPVKMVSIKEVWKGAGQGYAIMFFAWTIISLILNVMGITETTLNLPF